MDKAILNKRLRMFAVRVIRMTEKMPDKMSTRVLGNQLIRSVTSVAANYSASCRARSKRDFISKLKIVEEEADETIVWLDLMVDTGIFPPEKMNALKTEANEILSIIVASIKTAKRNLDAPEPRVSKKSKIENRPS